MEKPILNREWASYTQQTHATHVPSWSVCDGCIPKGQDGYCSALLCRSMPFIFNWTPMAKGKVTNTRSLFEQSESDECIFICSSRQNAFFFFLLWLDVTSRAKGNSSSFTSPPSSLFLFPTGAPGVSYVLYAQVIFPDAVLSFTFMFSHTAVCLLLDLPGAGSRAKKLSGHPV